MRKNSPELLPVMVAAVAGAARLCESVRATSLQGASRDKADLSPVTVADLGAQAVIRVALRRSCEAIPVLGEEDADMLDDAAFAERVVTAVAAIEPGMDLSDVREALGREVGAGSAAERFVLDPIDGTKGYLRGDQYAIALAYLRGDQVVAAALGCPSLDGPSGRGVILAAAADGGVTEVPTSNPTLAGRPVGVTEEGDVRRFRFVESVESAHSAHGPAEEIRDRLGVTADVVRIDSQCKYAAVARGDAEAYLRLPTRKDYREKAWDHAAGWLCVTAGGGRVTDVDGRPIDWSHGARLESNRGIVATNGRRHDDVVAAVRSVIGE